MLYKVDLHTHSVASSDGALRPEHYQEMLESGGLQCIAVTDHNTVDMALYLRAKLGDRIIVGEEISTTAGDIIGLYLKEVVPGGLELRQAVNHIRRQDGLVYIPHPFETLRQGLNLGALDSIAKEVDIIEIYNGRAVFQNRSQRAITWSIKHRIPGAAASDAHGNAGWSKTYTILKAMPQRYTLSALLQQGNTVWAWPGVRALLYPKWNRIRKRVGHG